MKEMKKSKKLFIKYIKKTRTRSAQQNNKQNVYLKGKKTPHRTEEKKS